jgi:hypothetical protein
VAVFAVSSPTLLYWIPLPSVSVSYVCVLRENGEVTLGCLCSIFIQFLSSLSSYIAFSWIGLFWVSLAVFLGVSAISTRVSCINLHKQAIACTCFLCFGLLFYFLSMASITSLLAQKAGSSVKTSPFISVASMATGMMTNEVSPAFCNRNPRNLERLRIAWRPTGYHLEAPGREFWHKYVCKQF